MNLDQELLYEAQEILGTRGTTDTIHEALLDVVRRHDRRVLLEYDFPGLTPEWLDGLRRTREIDLANELHSV